MDLNEILFHHQVALIKAAEPLPGHCGKAFDLVRHYETRLARLRANLGVAVYPQWSAAPAPCCS